MKRLYEEGYKKEQLTGVITPFIGIGTDSGKKYYVVPNDLEHFCVMHVNPFQLSLGKPRKKIKELLCDVERWMPETHTVYCFEKGENLFHWLAGGDNLGKKYKEGYKEDPVPKTGELTEYVGFTSDGADGKGFISYTGTRYVPVVASNPGLSYGDASIMDTVAEVVRHLSNPPSVRKFYCFDSGSELGDWLMSREDLPGETEGKE
jgi:hypothetical protein